MCGAHPEHAVHVCDLGRVEAQRLVERKRFLPSRNEGTYDAGRGAGREAGELGRGAAAGAHGEQVGDQDRLRVLYRVRVRLRLRHRVRARARVRVRAEVRVVARLRLEEAHRVGELGDLVELHLRLHLLEAGLELRQLARFVLPDA